jgi:hypothetical protein
MYSWTLEGPGRVRLILHGSACDRIGAEACEHDIMIGADGRVDVL